MKKTITAAIVASLLSMVAVPAMADNGRHGHNEYKQVHKAYKEQQKAYRKYEQDRYKYERDRYRYNDRYYNRDRYERDNDRRYRPVYENNRRDWRRGQV